MCKTILFIALAAGLGACAAAPGLRLVASGAASHERHHAAERPLSPSSRSSWELRGVLGLSLAPRVPPEHDPELHRPRPIVVDSPCRLASLCRWEHERRLSALVGLGVVP